uniref:TSP1_spondin domain-containing protein n=1 Tax=Macrostomum lignano TaxID=282301 RepID=A0A1I8IJK1_9PLAT
MSTGRSDVEDLWMDDDERPSTSAKRHRIQSGDSYIKRKQFFKPSLMTTGCSAFNAFPIGLAVILALVILANIPCVLLERGLFCMKVSKATYSNTTGEWSQWTNCSILCGFGKQIRYRQDSSTGHAKLAEMRLCEDRSGCEDDLRPKSRIHWTEWSTWSACNQRNCESGIKTRIHLYYWSAWSSWQECSSTCEDGFQVRSRECISKKNKTSKLSTLDCQKGGLPGNGSEYKDCSKKIPCNVTFSWAGWGDWSACSKSCDTGQMRRTRQCITSSGHFVHINRCTPFTKDVDLYTETKHCASGAPCGATWTEWEKWNCVPGKEVLQSRKRNCVYKGKWMKPEYCQVERTSNPTLIVVKFNCHNWLLFVRTNKCKS